MSDVLRQAIDAIMAGDKDTGQRLLFQVLRTDPGNEKAWLWLASAVDDIERRRECLRYAFDARSHKPTGQSATRRNFQGRCIR